jgi:fructokinase
MVVRLESSCERERLSVGLCTPGAISPATGLLKNANSTCLNGRPFKQDVEAAVGRPVRVANDADCLALSEAQADGAGVGAYSVFAVILGTGVGGGIVIDGRLHYGPHAIAGEWGHNPLPWPQPSMNEIPGPQCWCGHSGCIETWLSGPGLEADFRRSGGAGLDTAAIVQHADMGDITAAECLHRYENRLARALATVINLLDPEVIVLGGGVSNVERLYERVSSLWSMYVFSDVVQTRLVQAKHGDSSGVRGAAWLWP